MRLIDADKLKAKVRAQEWKRDPAVMLALDWIYMLINEQPTIDAVPVVRGEWKQGKEFPSYPRKPFIGDAYYCSNCEEEAYWDTDYGQQLFDFCPMCGADMRGAT